MPIIVLIAVLAIYGAANIHDTSAKNKKAFTEKELDRMLNEMIGKSKKECRKIIKRYRK